jgi:hypothetical protein
MINKVTVSKALVEEASQKYAVGGNIRNENLAIV